jgi:hypothetical protein
LPARTKGNDARYCGEEERYGLVGRVPVDERLLLRRPEELVPPAVPRRRDLVVSHRAAVIDVTSAERRAMFALERP